LAAADSAWVAGGTEVADLAAEGLAAEGLGVATVEEGLVVVGLVVVMAAVATVGADLVVVATVGRVQCAAQYWRKV
jgi:hypothetical protein